MKDDWFPIGVIVVIIAIGLFGGAKNPNGGGLLSVSNSNTTESQQVDLQRQINDTQYKVNDLQKQVEEEQDKKVASVYKGIVSLQYVNRGSDASSEYLVIKVINKTQPINITGWTLVSTSTGTRITIPKSTYLYFAGGQNAEQDVYVENGDTIYLTTGNSPIGSGFKVNKCSGYLTQFQIFNPGVNTNCPLPHDENLSSIPRSPVNDACLDYIQNFPQCRIQTETLPLNWGYECTNFIYTKITYPSCVDTHKNDSNFYQHEWRIYLKRSERIWKNYRENITLYDNNGKVVDTLYY
jgi:hypothetical protein